MSARFTPGAPGDESLSDQLRPEMENWQERVHKDSPRAGPPLEGRRTVLRPVRPADYPFLFELSLDETVNFRWRLRNSTPSFEAFSAGLWQGILAQFMIERRRDRAPVGLISLYNADFRNSFGYLALVVAPEFMSTRHAFDALVLFLNYTFRTSDFRMVYADTTDLSFSTFAAGEGRFYHLEATLPDHEFYDGRYWDMHILSFRRTDWVELFAEWLPRVLPPQSLTEGRP